jgi:NAD-dependent deacetylase
MSVEALHKAARIIRDAEYAVALTGAGISTPSGIPDFRSPNSGLWEDDNAVNTASILGFKRNPQAFFKWMRPLATTLLAAQPNPAHIALAELEHAGYIKSVITQNIDMLHSKAGSQVVHEVHGHLRQATCIECFTEYDAQPLIQQFLADDVMPRCEKCGGILKPNVILYGEQLPVRPLFAAQQAARRCDVMLVVGSSLQVAPAGDFPMMVKDRGARLIQINYLETHIDSMVDVMFHANAAEVLPQIAALVMEAN